jgi:hypothetical protein
MIPRWNAVLPPLRILIEELLEACVAYLVFIQIERVNRNNMYGNFSGEKLCSLDAENLL